VIMDLFRSSIATSGLDFESLFPCHSNDSEVARSGEGVDQYWSSNTDPHTNTDRVSE
jgi:hypothetical protein